MPKRCTPKCELRPQWTQRHTATAVQVDLPVPPSANKLFGMVNGRRVKTPAYRAWRQNAVLVGSLARPHRIVGPCQVSIMLPPGRQDADNLVKPLMDACVEIGIIADDGPSYVTGLHVTRDRSEADARLTFLAVAS